MWGDILSVSGLALTAIGAWVTAKSVVLSEDDAIHIGVARYASESREENLALPAVQNLLQASRGARIGLWIVLAGTVLQLVPAALHLIR